MAFVRSGLIVDEITDVLREVITALQVVKDALIDLDVRVKVLENER